MENSYTVFYYIGIGFLLLIIGVAIWNFIRHSRKKRQPNYNEDYVRALNYLLDGDLKQAVHFFHQTVIKDTENIDAYLKLGDIFRQQNKIDKAIKIHNELLVRRNLNPLLKSQILRSLILDYTEAKQFNKALEKLNSLFAIEPKNVWAKRQQLKIYEAMNDWEKAFKTLKQLAKMESIPDLSQQLALYKVEEAKNKFALNEEKAGRILLREAIKIYPKCAPAYLELGDSYVREQRENDAAKVWIDFIQKVPEDSHLVFDRLQDVLYSLGTYSELEQILEKLYLSDKANLKCILLLADIYVRKGDIDGAIELCERAMEKFSDKVPLKLRLIRLYARKGLQSKAIELAVSLSDEKVVSEKGNMY